jgi:hypothetical protein
MAAHEFYSKRRRFQSLARNFCKPDAWSGVREPEKLGKTAKDGIMTRH